MNAAPGSVDGEALTPSAVAEAAGESVRTLNHLTLAAPSPNMPGWEDIGDIYRVLGELRLVVERLPQACRQIAMGIQRLGDRDEWLSDWCSDVTPGELVEQAMAALNEVEDPAGKVGWNLHLAHEAVGHLHQ